MHHIPYEEKYEQINKKNASIHSPLRDESLPVGPEFLREPLLRGPECAAHEVSIHGRTQDIQQL